MTNITNYSLVEFHEQQFASIKLLMGLDEILFRETAENNIRSTNLDSGKSSNYFKMVFLGCIENFYS